MKKITTLLTKLEGYDSYKYFVCENSDNSYSVGFQYSKANEELEALFSKLKNSHEKYSFNNQIFSKIITNNPTAENIWKEFKKLVNFSHNDICKILGILKDE